MIVEAGEGVAEIDGDSLVQTRRKAQQSLLASGTGKFIGLECGDHCWPVDGRHGSTVDESASGGDESAGEVGPVQPRLGDEQVGGGFEAVDALRLGAQRRRQLGR